MVPNGCHTVIRRKDKGSVLVAIEFTEQFLCSLDNPIDHLNVCHVFLTQNVSVYSRLLMANELTFENGP